MSGHDMLFLINLDLLWFEPCVFPNSCPGWWGGAAVPGHHVHALRSWPRPRVSAVPGRGRGFRTGGVGRGQGERIRPRQRRGKHPRLRHLGQPDQTRRQGRRARGSIFSWRQVRPISSFSFFGVWFIVSESSFSQHVVRMFQTAVLTPVSSTFPPPPTTGVLRPASRWPLTYPHVLPLLWTRSNLRTTEKARNWTTFPAALAPTKRLAPTDIRISVPLFPQGE